MVRIIPSKGRSLECGFCHHVWFYTKDEKIENTVSKKDKFENITETKNIIEEKNRRARK